MPRMSSRLGLVRRDLTMIDDDEEAYRQTGLVVLEERLADRVVGDVMAVVANVPNLSSEILGEDLDTMLRSLRASVVEAYPSGKQVDGSSVGVVRRVRHVLVVERQARRF